MAGMVLKRRVGESVVMTVNGEEIQVSVLQIKRDAWALLQFNAPQSVSIDRTEKKRRQQLEGAQHGQETSDGSVHTDSSVDGPRPRDTDRSVFSGRRNAASVRPPNQRRQPR